MFVHLEKGSFVTFRIFVSALLIMNPKFVEVCLCEYNEFKFTIEELKQSV